MQIIYCHSCLKSTTLIKTSTNNPSQLGSPGLVWQKIQQPQQAKELIHYVVILKYIQLADQLINQNLLSEDQFFFSRT